MIIQMEFTKLYKINLDHGEALETKFELEIERREHLL